MSEKRKPIITKKEEEAMTNINIFRLKLIIFAYSLVTLIEELAMLYIENRNEFGKLKENSPLGFWILIIMITISKIIKKCCFEFFSCSMILYFLYNAKYEAFLTQIKIEIIKSFNKIKKLN